MGSLTEYKLMDIISIVSLVIGVASLVTSIVFFWLGAKSERRNREILDTINSAIQTWQSRIMDSSIELLSAQPEVVGKRLMLEEAKARRSFLESLAEQIEYIIQNPSELNGPQQSHHFELLLRETLDHLEKHDSSTSERAGDNRDTHNL